MQLKSVLRSAVPVVAIVALILIASCNGSNKKYGCPNKLHSSSSIR